jgi:PAS fold
MTLTYIPLATRLLATLDYFSFTLEEWQSGDPGRFVHPEDRERFRNEAPSKFLKGLPHETEMRSLGKNGTYRWFLIVFLRSFLLRRKQSSRLP